MKIAKMITLFLLCVFVVNVPWVAAVENEKEMTSLETYDQELNRLKDEAEDISKTLEIVKDVITKAQSGEYIIMYPMIPVKKHDFEMMISSEILQGNTGFYEMFGTPDKIRAYVKYTKFVRDNGDKIIEKYLAELDENKKQQERCVRERNKVLTGGQQGEIIYLHLITEPTVTWATEDRFYRDRYTDVDVKGCNVTYSPDPKNIPVNGSFYMRWDEPPMTIGRDGLDWKFNARIISMPKGNDGCGIKVAFSDFFHAAGAEQWTGIGQDGTVFNGDQVVVKLRPDIDALRGETEAWININIYELSVTYKFKVTRDAAPPLGIR